MNDIKLGNIFKRALAIEDSEDVGEMYKDFFDSEGLALDLVCSVSQVSEIEKYDLLICDWLLGRGTAKKWLMDMKQLKKLPKVVIIITGMVDIEMEVHDLPCLVIYKPFEFTALKEEILKLKLIQ